MVLYVIPTLKPKLPLRALTFPSTKATCVGRLPATGKGQALRLDLPDDDESKCQGAIDSRVGANTSPIRFLPWRAGLSPKVPDGTEYSRTPPSANNSSHGPHHVPR